MEEHLLTHSACRGKVSRKTEGHVLEGESKVLIVCALALEYRDTSLAHNYGAVKYVYLSIEVAVIITRSALKEGMSVSGKSMTVQVDIDRTVKHRHLDGGVRAYRIVLNVNCNGSTGICVKNSLDSGRCVCPVVCAGNRLAIHKDHERNALFVVVLRLDHTVLAHLTELVGGNAAFGLDRRKVLIRSVTACNCRSDVLRRISCGKLEYRILTVCASFVLG